MTEPPASGSTSERPWLDPARETTQSEVLPLASVLLKHPRDAFGEESRIANSWRVLGYTAPPDLSRAIAEFDELVEILECHDVTTHLLPAAEATDLDSLYPRDASIPTDRGVVLSRMGKPGRRAEPEEHEEFYRAHGVPIVGRVEAPGTLEGGDVAWLSPRLLAVARSYRTNDDGLAQLRSFLPPDVEMLRLDAPHWRGPGDVFHLMSVLSPLAPKKLLVYSPLLTIRFREALLARAFELVEVPDEEFSSLGGNVLTMAPDTVIIPAGNPQTRSALTRAGVHSIPIEACEICLKGAGGPTCLSRPLVRRIEP